MDLKGLTTEVKTQIKNEVGEFIVEQILKSVSSQQSPVVGENWPKLDPEYKKKKLKELGSGKADLEGSGDMLDALTFKPTKEGVEIGFFNSEAWKADGHLKFSGAENDIPKRRFLPAEGQTFKSDIREEVDRIITDAVSENESFLMSDLREIETPEELFDYLKEKIGDLSRADLRLAVLRNNDLLRKLRNLDLLDLLSA